MPVRWKRRDVDYVGLEELGFTSEEVPRRRWFSSVGVAAGSLIQLAVICALLGSLIAVPALGAAAAVRFGLGKWEAMPVPTVSADTPLPQRSTIYASDGSLVATLYAENRVVLSSADIPDVVRHALIATEDSRFYTHNGVDWVATARALIDNVRGSASAGGGSGITQQYVKNMRIAQATNDAERAAATAGTWKRKLDEARAAIALERQFTKDEILTSYLNTVYFGDGAYGIGAAAQRYFSKPARALTASEAALLIGIINNPSVYNPVRNPQDATQRRAHVLGRMADEGYLTEAEASTGAQEPLGLKLSRPKNGCSVSPFPIYCRWVVDTILSDPVFGATEEDRARLLQQGDLTIRTALVPSAQRHAEASAREALRPRGNVATALAIVQPGTGRVLALATNKPYGTGKGETELMLPVLTAFQHGSTFKPLTAVAALEAGIDPEESFTAGDTFIPENRNYPPGGFHNAGDGPGGTFNMGGALKTSVNTWFVQLEDRIGVRYSAETAYRMGLTSLPTQGPGAITEKDASLTLGTYETSPLLLANTFATLAAHGVHCNPLGITAMERGGKPMEIPQPDCRQVIRASTADTITSLLQGVVEPDGTGFRAALPDKRPIAGKTGTTNESAAAWFVGYTPQYATSVWVGDPRGGFQHPLTNLKSYGQVWEPVYGGTVPALIWRSTMEKILQGQPIQQFAPAPDGSVVETPPLMPDVRGMSVPDALRTLADAGFTATVQDTPTAIPGIPPGRVTGSDPAPGATIPFDQARTVTIYATPAS